MRRPFRKLVFAFAFSVIFVGCFLGISKNNVSASTGSIAIVNTYPCDGETYRVVDHVTQRIMSVNTNTTFAVSIDGGSPIPMIYEGLINEVASNDSVARDWYTWEATIQPLTTPGLHTFQFFGKYYVWQETDQYWAEFNYSSNIRHFTIENPETSNSGNNSNTFVNKELSVSISEPLSLKLSQSTINETKSQSDAIDTSDSAFAFLLGTICAVAGVVLLVLIVIIQIFSGGKKPIY